MPHDVPARASWLSTLGWAAYLACSWTWCIGMFLPILLVRDFGVWGFVVFAIPNVVGAAAFGWVLRRPGAGESLLQIHAPAVFWFAIVTVLFQLYWFCWMCAIGGWRLGVGFGAGALIVLALSKWLEPRDPDRTRLAACTLILSLTAFATFLLMQWPVLVPSPNAAQTRDVVWLAPVCIFGFLFCPYLDPTFHRARTAAPGSLGTAAFTIGFGLFFLLMILFTLAYSGYLPTARAQPTAATLSLPVSLTLGIHFFPQLLFTIHVQLRDIQRLRPYLGLPPAVTSTTLPTDAAPKTPPPPPAIPRRKIPALALWLFGLVFALALLFIPNHAGLSLGEIIYRLFLSFYALAFPAYVWLCMIPTRDAHSGTTGNRGKRKLITLAAAIALAAPFYWMGFIQRHTWYLAPGLGVVLLARLFIRGRPQLQPGDPDPHSIRGGL